MRPYAIVHLTDLHLTALDGAGRSEPRLWGRLRGMNATLGRILASDEVRAADLVVITGDVTDQGHLAAWHVLRDALTATGLSGRVAVLPGNHDVSCLGVRARPVTEDMARASAGLESLGQPARFPWVRRLDEGRVALFAVDSTRKANLTGITNALGALGENQLIRLGRLLERHREVPVKLLLIHHSPNIPGAATSRRRGETVHGLLDRKLHELEAGDRRALRVLCRVHGVRAILHGHTHDAIDRRVNGVRMIGAPASTEPAADGRVRIQRYLVARRPPHRLVSETLLLPA